MTVSITGGSGTITYQWQSSTDGIGGWANAAGTGSTTNTFTQPSATPGTTYYRVLVNASGSDCQQAVSSIVTAVIIPDIVISAQPTNVHECVGGTDQMTVSITGGSGTITYQWQSSADGIGGWANAAGTGSTTNTFTPPSTTAGTTYYRVLVNASGTDCAQSVSTVVTAIIIPDILITAQPTNVNECVGGTDQMTVSITGGSGTITYQWQSSADGIGGWANAAGIGSTTNTFTPPSTTAGTTYYRVLVNASGSDCQQAVSSIVTAVIIPDIVISAQPTNVHECVGGTDQMTVSITGGSGTITYQWQSSADGIGGWANAAGTGSTTNTFTPPSTTAGTTYYRVLVNASGTDCAQSVSTVVTAIIIPDILITAQPTNVNECVGGTDQMTVSITGGSGTITYQWQSSADGIGGWANAAGTGSTTNTFTPPSTTAGTTYYRVLVNASGSDCQQAVSSIVTAVIIPDIVISAQPTNVHECVGGTDQMTVSITGGSGTITYQWQSSADGIGGWANAAGTGSTTNTFTPPSTTAGTTYYRVLVNASGTDCAQSVSTVVTAIIIPDILITAQPTNVNECVGGTDQMTVSITGGSGTITYQWQSSADGIGGWANAAGIGSTTNTFTPPSTTAGTTYYRVLVNASGSDCQQAVSTVVTAIIIPDIVITAQPTNVNECVGGTDQMTVSITGGSGTITYQWQSSADGIGGWANAAGTGSTTNTFTPPSTTAGTTYYRVLINENRSEGAQSVSSVVTAIIIPDIVITAQPTNVNECVGGTDQMTVNITGGSGTITYQWQSSTDGLGGWANAAGTGSTTNTFTPPSTTAGTTYYRVLGKARDTDDPQSVS